MKNIGESIGQKGMKKRIGRRMKKKKAGMKKNKVEVGMDMRKRIGRRMGEKGKQVTAEQHAHQLWLSSVTQDPSKDPLERSSKVFFTGGTPQFEALQAVLDAVRADLEDGDQQVALTEFPACPVAVRMIRCMCSAGWAIYIYDI